MWIKVQYYTLPVDIEKTRIDSGFFRGFGLSMYRRSRSLEQGGL